MGKKKEAQKKEPKKEEVGKPKKEARFSGTFSLKMEKVLNNPGQMVLDELDLALGRLRDESVERISQLRDGHTKDTHVFVKY